MERSLKNNFSIEKKLRVSKSPMLRRLFYLANKLLCSMHKKILLLGSGELGKELVIDLKRLGQTVIAADSYAGAPAMQVADGFEVLDMLNGEQLDSIVSKHKPDLIVPEIEAIRTERFYEYEKQKF